MQADAELSSCSFQRTNIRQTETKKRQPSKSIAITKNRKPIFMVSRLISVHQNKFTIKYLQTAPSAEGRRRMGRQNLTMFDEEFVKIVNTVEVNKETDLLTSVYAIFQHFFLFFFPPLVSFRFQFGCWAFERCAAASSAESFNFCFLFIAGSVALSPRRIVRLCVRQSARQTLGEAVAIPRRPRRPHSSSQVDGLLGRAHHIAYNPIKIIRSTKKNKTKIK